jgi:ketopantoate reductase
MRVPVFGAGVLGSLYAAPLHGAGHDVTVLVRRDQLESTLPALAGNVDVRALLKQAGLLTPATDHLGIGTEAGE